MKVVVGPLTDPLTFDINKQHAELTYKNVQCFQQPPCLKDLA